MVVIHTEYVNLFEVYYVNPENDPEVRIKAFADVLRKINATGFIPFSMPHLEYGYNCDLENFLYRISMWGFNSLYKEELP